MLTCLYPLAIRTLVLPWCPIRSHTPMATACLTVYRAASTRIAAAFPGCWGARYRFVDGLIERRMRRACGCHSPLCQPDVAGDAYGSPRRGQQGHRSRLPPTDAIPMRSNRVRCDRGTRPPGQATPRCAVPSQVSCRPWASNAAVTPVSAPRTTGLPVLRPPARDSEARCAGAQLPWNVESEVWYTIPGAVQRVRTGHVREGGSKQISTPSLSGPPAGQRGGLTRAPVAGDLPLLSGLADPRSASPVAGGTGCTPRRTRRVLGRWPRSRR
jgi:hypothetical protein